MDTPMVNINFENIDIINFHRSSFFKWTVTAYKAGKPLISKEVQPNPFDSKPNEVMELYDYLFEKMGFYLTWHNDSWTLSKEPLPPTDLDFLCQVKNKRFCEF